jgi:hypothetical protein
LNTITEEPTLLDGSSSSDRHPSNQTTTTPAAAAAAAPNMAMIDDLQDGSDAWMHSLLNGPLLEFDPSHFRQFRFSPQFSSVGGPKPVDMNNDVPHHRDTPSIAVKVLDKQPVAKKRSSQNSHPLQDAPPSKRKHVQEYTRLDVLSGRGGLGNNHNGNREFRAAKTQLQPAYLNGTRSEKMDIVWKLFKTIQKKGGRFLERERPGEDDGWYEMHCDDAYKKCRQALATKVLP